MQRRKSFHTIVLTTLILLVSSARPAAGAAPPAWPITASDDAVAETIVIVEEPSLTPAYGPTCQTGWYRFVNNREHYAYLTLNTNNPAQSTNAGRWTPNLPRAGRWRVEAFIPTHNAFTWPCTGQYISWDTSDARYAIYHSNGSHTVSRNQRPLFDGWLDLGVYDFAAGSSGYVKLSDLNGEANVSYFISFSAVRFVWVGEGSVNTSVVMEDPTIHPGYGGGMCDSAWYRFTNDRGHYAYLTLNTNQSPQSTNWADWHPNLPQAGNYKIEAYIATHNPVNWQCPYKYIQWDTSDARYTIYHASGQAIVSRNQAPLFNEWLDLGTYHFNAGTAGWVKLTDLNGEANLSHTVSFSAMRFTLQSGGSSDVKTLILVNREQLASLYGNSEATRIMNKLSQLAAHSSVQGKVIQVENDPDVAAAYYYWGQNQTKVGCANHVGDEIHDLIDQQMAAHPELRYIVIVGDDRVIPFYRVRDRTRTPEHRYGLVSPNTTVGSALQADRTLTDNFYADKDRASWHGHHPYIPDLAVGRLIENPDEIVSQIDLFLASGGRVPTNAAAVGWDFVQDAAREIRDTWQSEGLSVNGTLIGNSWGSNHFIEEILNRRHDLVSLNHHANHYTIGTPGGYVNSHHISSSTGNHSQSLFFSLGCHSGLNVPPANPVDSFDLAQVFVRKGAIYVGNTGYGWGSIWSVALSERLMAIYADMVYRRSLSVGQALAAAKRYYCSSEGRFDAYDEKIVLEATLYGLPMYEFYTSGAMAAAESESKPYALTSQTVSVATEGLTRNSVAYEFPEFAAVTADDGIIYTLADQAQVDDGAPIQPRVAVDVTFIKTSAHGAVFRGGTYTDIPSFDPVVDLAVTEAMTVTEPEFDAPGWYPPLPYHLNRLDDEETLVQVLGQFHSRRNTERLYSQMQFDVYYHDSSSDWIPPTVSGTWSELQDGEANVSVETTDEAGIQTVVVAFTEGTGTWENVELQYDGSSWVGSFPATSSTEFLVQVVDGVGNVAVDDNDGRYFRPGGAGHAVYLPIVVQSWE